MLGMQGNKRKNHINRWCILFCVVTIGIVVLAKCLIEISWKEIIYTVLIGVVSSLAASSWYEWMMKGINEEETNVYLKTLEDLRKEVLAYNRLMEEGIISIRKKSYYRTDKEFWKSILLNTVERLDLVGHDLSNWLTEEYQKIFSEQLINMAKHEKTVRLVMTGVSYDENRMKRAERDKNFRDNLKEVEKTYFFLYKLIKELPVNKRSYIEGYIVEPSEMTYMYIRTDNACYISPYLSSEKYDIDSFLIEFDINAERCQCFMGQFEEFMKDEKNKIQWIQ